MNFILVRYLLNLFLNIDLRLLESKIKLNIEVDFILKSYLTKVTASQKNSIVTDLKNVTNLIGHIWKCLRFFLDFEKIARFSRYRAIKLNTLIPYIVIGGNIKIKFYKGNRHFIAITIQNILECYSGRPKIRKLEVI